jgi:hypothetical protein
MVQMWSARPAAIVRVTCLECRFFWFSTAYSHQLVLSGESIITNADSFQKLTLVPGGTRGADHSSMHLM